jgi:hypothetical protein
MGSRDFIEGITFNKNETQNSTTTSKTFFRESDNSIIPTADKFTFEGCRIISWTSLPDGTGVTYPNGTAITNTSIVDDIKKITQGDFIYYYDTDNVILYAHWEVSVTFNNIAGGTGTMLTQTFECGTAIPPTALIKNNFTYGTASFLGWAKTANSNIIYLVDEDNQIQFYTPSDAFINLYAVFGYTITFNGYNSSTIRQNSYVNTTFSIPRYGGLQLTAIPLDKVSNKWVDANDSTKTYKFGDTPIFTSNTMLNAVLTIADSITITFYPGATTSATSGSADTTNTQGTGTMQNQIVARSISAQLDANTFIEPGSSYELGKQLWSGIACSSDGKPVFACVSYGGIYIKKDITDEVVWTKITNSSQNLYWTGIACNSEGTKVFACVSGGGIYSCLNPTVKTPSWTKITNISQNLKWSGITCDSTGTKLFACVDGGGIYTCIDSTIATPSWTLTTAPTKKWTGITCDSIGKKIFACIEGDGIYTCLDSTVASPSWTLTTAPTETWSGIKCDSAGKFLVACTYGDGLYSCKDSTLATPTWVSYLKFKGFDRLWTGITSSAEDDSIFLCSKYDNIYSIIGDTFEIIYSLNAIENGIGIAVLAYPNFLGWSTNYKAYENDTPLYADTQSVTFNKDTSLYAVWDNSKSVPPGPGSTSCFPMNALVHLENGVITSMDRLQIGDKVMTGPNIYSDVYFFTHSDNTIISTFVKLSTKSGLSLLLSPCHYIYTNNRLVAASEVKETDTLLTVNDPNDAIVSKEIVTEMGLYNPHTLNGNIMVNGVLVSTYTTAVNPYVAHMLLFPVRVLYNIGKFIYNLF